MDKNTQHLLLSELYSATGYLERLNFALDEVHKATQLPQVKELKQGSIKSLLIFVEREILQSTFQTSSNTTRDLFLDEVVELTRNVMVSLIKFQLDAKGTLDSSVNYINLVYSLCYPIHKMVDHYGNMDVQLPRTALIEMDQNPDNLELIEDDEVKIIPKFELKKESVIESQNNQVTTISSLQWQREKKAKEFIRKGHEAIFKQEHEKAQDFFSKALNYIESAEILTLLGWSHSLMGENEKAKSYCLKAIQKDPDYGPPYNDMGTYLMDDNHLNESLKWFELAKKCSNYQNREYPFINAGRVYMAKQEYSKALEEFSKALAFAPHHEELHATVKKLKETIHIRRKNELVGEELPPMS